MTREQAYKILTTYIKNPNLIKHHLAAESVMRSLYLKLHPQVPDPVIEEKWGIVGLLHDADYELTRETPSRHTLVLEEKIGNELEPDVLHAIMAHNWDNNGIEPQSPMDWAMYCCDELTGLIIAAALVHPDKKLASLDAGFIMNRFNDNTFAKGAERSHIAQCTDKLGIPLMDFIDLSLKSMQNISGELGL